MGHQVVLDFARAELELLAAILPVALLAVAVALKYLPRPAFLQSPIHGLSPDPVAPSPAELRQQNRVRGLVALTAIEAGCWTVFAGATLIVGRMNETGMPWLSLGTRLGVAAGWIVVAASTLVRPPETAPYRTFAFLLSHFVLLALFIISLSLHPLPGVPLWRPWLTLAIHSILLTACLLVVLSFPLHAPSTTPFIPTTSLSPEPSPETTVSLGSWLTFQWVSPLLALGSKDGGQSKLGYSDVWPLDEAMDAEGVKRSAERLAQAISVKRMIPRIWWTNSLDLTLSLTLGFCSSFLAYCSPYFLKQILSSLASTDEGIPNPDLRKSAFIYAGLALLAQFARAEVDLQQLWHERRCIVRCRSMLMGEVYAKALKRRDLAGVLPPATTGKEGGPKGTVLKGKDGKVLPEGRGIGSTGKVVQMMSSDSMKIANQLMSLSSTVAAPFELIVAIAFLYQLLGWTCLAGLSVLAISLPLNHVLVKRRIVMHRTVLSTRDQRMETLNEFIQAIRFVKYSASEENWLARVFKARNLELDWLLKTRLNYLMMNVVWQLTPDLVALISFACLTKIAGKELTVPVAFTSLALFALVRSPMSQLPNSITQLLQTYVSIQRLEAFLEEPEVEPWVSSLRSDAPASSSSSPKVAFVNASFRYQDSTTSTEAASKVVVPDVASTGGSQELAPPAAAVVLAPSAPETMPASTEETVFELKDLDVEFPLGKLTLVCGATGSGKSSLFLALLGEIDRLQGEVQLPKAPSIAVDSETGLYDGVAYASQLPWLQHASIKNNILFGSPYEEERYNAVLDATALRTDLEMFEAGDEAEIGERGLTLSGGQKARCALARAVYSRAKTVLLDDPLSAVDMHTARHLVTHCLAGPLMKGRTIILITHHVALTLPCAEYLIKLSSGRIVLKTLVSELNKADLDSELLEDAGLDAPATDEPPESISSSKKDKDPVSAVKAQLAPAMESEPTTRTSSPQPGPDAVAAAKPKGDGKLMETEARAQGRVAWSVYNRYLSAAGYDTWIMIVLLIFGGRAFRVVDRYFFKIWGESYEKSSLPLFQLVRDIQFHLVAPLRSFGGHAEVLGIPELPSARDNVNIYLWIYTLIVLANLLLAVLGILAGYRGSFRASRILFTQTLERVTRAPFRYFDTTPTGRLLNRFSTDFNTIDTSLTDQVRICLTHATTFIVNLAVIVIVSPMFLPPAFIIVFIYIKLSISFIRASRDLRRLQSNAQSPIFSKFGETLNGIVSVRAFGAERRFLTDLYSSVNVMLATHYAGAMINRYLLWRFDCLGAIAVATTTFLALSTGTSSGMAALAITSAQNLVLSIYWLCRFASALEVDLNAVERVTELLTVPQEPLDIIESNRPPAIWPSDQGGLTVEDLVIQYDSSLPAVIKGVSFDLKPRQKVGLVGRTGSGKSTLALSLLRFTEPTSGRIIIDGIDITKIGLKDLRSRLTLIHQEATLFSGTVRNNLDPFEEHSPEECLDALARVGMLGSASTRPSRNPSPAPSIRGSNEDHTGHGALLTAPDDVGENNSDSTRVESGRLGVTLESQVSSGGANFSAGQRQLLAMARAMLRRSRVIIMDEASASVDLVTDRLIQRTMREEFSDSLILTIAHRLATVIDYDVIIVLDQGKVVEIGSPRELLSKEESAFKSMCKESADWQELKAIALGS